MLGKCFGVICVLSLVSALYTGNISALSDAVLEGAGRGVTLSFSMLGMMCLWCGIMEILKEAGAVGVLSRMLSPILSRVFPETFLAGEGSEEITATVAANMLGVSNAATPFALKAMEKLDKANPIPERASDDMVTLSVLGSSSVSFLPTTVITLRYAAGSVRPYAVIVPIWLCSLICAVTGVLLCRLSARGTRLNTKSVRSNTARRARTRRET